MHNPLIDIFFTYDSWATRRVLEVCCRLTQEQFEHPLGLGHGNLERTVIHLVGAQMFFADRLNRCLPRPRPDRDGRSRSPAEIVALFHAADLELRDAVTKSLDDHSLTDILNWTDEDTGPVDPGDQITYAVALAQMIDHSIHHRTQVVDMLRLLGVGDPMEWHPFEWDETARGRD